MRAAPAPLLRCIGVLLSLVGARAAVAQPQVQSTAPPAPETPSLPYVGLMADVGLPDGIIGSLVVRPVSWLRLNAGGGSNTASAGFRGGITWLPFDTGPSLSFEAGHFADGEANSVVRTFFGSIGRLGNYVQRVGYTYANLHAGLDFGGRSATFFIHGGFTYIKAGVRDVNYAIAQAELAKPTLKPGTTLMVNQDPVFRLWTPSVKLGFIFYLP